MARLIGAKKTWRANASCAVAPIRKFTRSWAASGCGAPFSTSNQVPKMAAPSFGWTKAVGKPAACSS